MDKRLYKSLLCVLGIIILIIPFTYIKADAGYGSSYGGGSSGGSFGSSYDSGSSSSDFGSSSSAGSGDGEVLCKADDVKCNTIVGISFAILVITMFAVLLSLIIFMCVSSDSMYNYTNKNHPVPEPVDKDKYKIMTQEEVNNIDDSIIIKDVVSYTYDLYVKEQLAWMNFDYDALREVVGDELYNSLKMQLDMMKENHEQNIMGNFRMIDSGILSINKTKDKEEMVVKLHVRMSDYIIDTNTNEVKFGNELRRLENTYAITLEKSKKKEIKKCPNCGAKIKNMASQKCTSCDSIIVKGTSNYIIVKQDIIKNN